MIKALFVDPHILCGLLFFAVLLLINRGEELDFPPKLVGDYANFLWSNFLGDLFYILNGSLT